MSPPTPLEPLNDPGGEVALSDVRGPSAVGGGWKRFFELLYLISVTEFKKTYFGTVLGYVWSLVRPLLLFAVLLFVFTKIFRLGSTVPNYPVMLLLNIVLIGFFQEATNNAVTSVVGQEAIVRKTQFPRLVIPMATVLTSFLNLGMNLIAVVIFLLVYGVDPTWTWLFLPLLIAILFVLTSATSLLLSSLYVRFRDIAIMWSVVAAALFYGSPILYPFDPEVVPTLEPYQSVMAINPLTPFFAQVRHWIIDPTAPTAVQAVGGWIHMIAPTAIFVAICVAGVWVFSRAAPRVAEEL